MAIDRSSQEYKAKEKARRSTPEYRAKRRRRDKMIRETPEGKAKLQARYATAKYKALKKSLNSKPEAVAWRRAYEAKSETKALRLVQPSRTNLNSRLSHSLRRRINTCVKRNAKSGSAVRDLGCTIEEFKTHIEAQFLPGMSWDNWSPAGWHLDHIRPLASFDLTDREQFLQACHYTNYRPLWAVDNWRKYNKSFPD